MIIQDIDKNIAGKYRNINVFIAGTEHVPPSALDVSFRMKELADWARKIIIKCILWNFPPFFTTNSYTFTRFKTAMVEQPDTNEYIFDAMQFPIAIIQKNDRQKYYRVRNG